MKSYIYLLVILFALGGSYVFGQSQPIPSATRPAGEGPPPVEGRPSLLAELGLSRDQMQRLRQLNSDRKPQMEAAQKALRDAMTSLDAAIYSDMVNEDSVAARIRDFQSAQAEIARIRFSSELAVRQILTPDQLVKFRDLRRQFEDESAKMRDERRKADGLPPFRRMNRRNRVPTNLP